MTDSRCVFSKHRIELPEYYQNQTAAYRAWIDHYVGHNHLPKRSDFGFIG